MTPPANTCTVTFSDAHAHTFVFPSVPGGPGGNVMATKWDALRNALLGMEAAVVPDLAAFTAGDTLTVTVTQP